jgi:hypothetical protein
MPPNPPSTTSSIRDTGGILHLAVALEQHPDASLVIYNRVSSYSQAGAGKVKLEEHTIAIYRAVRGLTENRPFRAMIRGVEGGKALDAPAAPASRDQTRSRPEEARDLGHR